MRLTALFNPEAGAGSWSEERIERLLRDAGHIPHVIPSRGKWRKQLDEDADAFVAVGGDGTVHKLMRAVVDMNVPVAIIPAGTANNVAHAFGYRVGDDLVERAANWLHNERVLSVARVQAGDTHRPIIEVIGTGAFVAMRQDRKKSPSVEGTPGEVLKAVRDAMARAVLRVDPVHVKLCINEAAHEGDYVLFECMNLPFYGPRLQVAPFASPEETALTVIGVRAGQRTEFVDWMYQGSDAIEQFTIGQGSRITFSVESDTHVDGKLWPKKRNGSLEIEGGANLLRVWV